MAQKNVWMTWLPSGEGAPGPDATVTALSQVGLNVAGSHWVDDLEKVAWVELGGMLLESGKHDVWLIAGRKEDFELARVRYGLSMVSAMLREGCETPLLCVCVGLDFQPEAANMPTLISNFKCFNGLESSWPAKLVAATFGKVDDNSDEFRLNVFAHPMLGQWFEVGPSDSQWQGVMFGVDGEGSISHHAVGPAGELPEKAVLEYPSQGIKAKLGEEEFTAWSVQNSIGPKESYFLKVEGFPNAVIIGADPGADDAEVFHLRFT